MKLRLYSEQNIRVVTGYKKNNFIDVKSGKNEDSLQVSFLASHQYMEIRKKDGFIGTFYFERKSHKKHHDFCWWEDAEVVFANNDVKL